MPEPIRLSAEKAVYTFSPGHPPAVAAESGATLDVETRDAYDRQFHESRDVNRYLRERRSRPSNPVTGPIFVEGVAPGDGIDVKIERIHLGPTGYVAAVSGIGVLGDTEIVPRISPFEVRPDGLWYEGRLRLPLRPMIGVIGVAPAAGAIPCVQLGYHGGNMDFNDITEGTLIHFPANAAGGLLALGDVHASMGFCEVHSGVNIDATVRLRVTRVPGAGWKRPWFETGSEIMTIGVEEQLDDAIREATRGMVAMLQQRLGVSYTEAIVLAGASVDIRLGQAAKFGVKVSAYAAFPKSALPKP
ncbi:MAG: acetamidase/formamidase family protein [Opitutaceae bacterium]|nr:acetamidase/formamidase family protein [Opitutaceae bacterium]